MTFPDAFPDSELMLIECLKDYFQQEPMATDYPFLESKVFTQPPKEWNAQKPLVIAHRVGGRSGRTTGQHRLDNPIYSVSVFAKTRFQAGKLARQISRILHQAVLDRWELAGPDGGVFTKYQEIMGPKHEYDGLTGKHSDAAMFDATYQMWLRGHYE